MEKEQALNQANQKIISNLSPEQAEGLIGVFTVGILNEASGHMGREISHIKVVTNLITGKIKAEIDGEKAPSGFASMNKFDESLKPVVMERAEEKKMKVVEAYRIEIKVGSWELEIYGQDETGENFSFLIDAIGIVSGIMKHKK